jgi:hypothetical protein
MGGLAKNKSKRYERSCFEAEASKIKPVCWLGDPGLELVRTIEIPDVQVCQATEAEYKF